MTATKARPEGSEATADAQARRLGLRLAGVFLLLAAALAVGGYFYVSQRQAAARAKAHWELQAIADLKLSQISHWREERLSDARFFSRARFVAQDLKRFLAEPRSQPARAAMLNWLDLLKAGDRYAAVIVYDAHFEQLLALPAAAEIPATDSRQLLKQALEERQVVMGDLHRHTPNGPVYLDIAFPVFEKADVKAGTALAVVLLELDARQFLFPLISLWPEPSETAETLLVRREGNQVVFLNDLRHRSGTALTLRLPLNSPDLPAAKLMRGDTGVVEGRDYRGVPVVAAGRLVPGTDWGIVAKVDRAEVYAPVRRQMRVALALLASLIVATALLVALLWRQRSAQFLERELAARRTHQLEIERINRLYAALSHINQAVVRAGSREELLRQICQALVKFGGCRMAWIGWLDEATQRLVSLAQYGENGHLQKLEVEASGPDGLSPAASAIREGRPSVHNDLVAGPEAGPWQQAACRSGLRALAAFPIQQESRVCGALTVYAGQKDFFGREEQALIEEAAGDISFGLDTLLNDQRRRRAEEQLARVNAELEQTVERRTAQLAEANSNLQAFASSAAHDLRAPLRSMRSFASLVLEDCGAEMSEEGRSMLRRVMAAGEQMAWLLDDLLEYSRISQADLKLEPVSLQATVEETLKLLGDDIRTKNAAVNVVKPLPVVVGHSATLVLLINNLVSNALKFMPPNVQPQIRIWAEQSGSFVRLWVQDNGIGIAPEYHEKIFAPFQRLHSKSDYAGTGLGLAIVSKGAERMGGRAGVESEPGKGSRFWVELKAA